MKTTLELGTLGTDKNYILESQNELTEKEVNAILDQIKTISSEVNTLDFEDFLKENYDGNLRELLEETIEDILDYTEFDIIEA